MDQVNKKLVRFRAQDADQISPGIFKSSMNISPLANVQAISIKTVVFSNNEYNIQTGVSDVFNYIYAGNSLSIVVPEGFYTALELLAVMKALIDPQINAINVGAAVTLLVAPYTFKITATTTLGITTYLSTGTISSNLGLTENSPAVAPGVPYVFNETPDLTGLHFVNISILAKDQGTIINAQGQVARYTNSIGVIPVDVAFGRLQIYNQADLDASAITYTHPEDLTSMVVSIRDDTGKHLANQQRHFTVEFMVWYE